MALKFPMQKRPLNVIIAQRPSGLPGKCEGNEIVPRVTK